MKQIRALALSRLVFIDETGVHLAMSRTHGRALKGKRVYEAKRQRPKISEKYTWISALSKEGLFAHFELNGSMTSEAFLVYVQQILLPALQPEQIVVMDNLACHKTDAVLQAFLDAGQQYIFLPPYSPEFSPIEECWSKFKAFLKKSAARTKDALNIAVDEAIESIVPEDIQAWFRHFWANIQSLC